MQSWHRSPLFQRKRGEHGEDALAAGGRHPVTVDALAIVRLEPLVDCRERSRRPGDGYTVGDVVAQIIRHVVRDLTTHGRPALVQFGLCRWICVEVTLCVANRAGPCRDEEGHFASLPDHELRAAAPDVDDDQR